ncbi:MAG TPA: transcription termination factor Rho [Ktedonobacterales bacterium]|nr:transcription termination factor Rho [Ktedonobacterales bacterium]
MITIADLETKTLPELRDLARGYQLAGYSTLKKQDLIFRLLQAESEQQGNTFASGLLEIVEEGFGFLRHEGLLPGPLDIYVSQTQIRRFGLRTGDMVSGQIRPPKPNEKYYSLLRVEAVNGIDPEAARNRPLFDNLTPVFPNEMYDLETADSNLTARIINLVAPVGRGQRGLIVAPPKAGKTNVLCTIANAIAANYKGVHLMIALIGERPEEVTDMRKHVQAEVYSSTFDEPASAHQRVAELVMERAKRLVEQGEHVVVLLDSITRLTRGYNLAITSTGRSLSGGLDPAALNPPRKFLGAARNVQEGGSLTVIATILVDTNSRMDDVIYEEFKGTGNMEIVLDRKLSERRIFPAVDITKSGTRREELLLAPGTLQAVTVMRRLFAQLAENDGIEATERLIGQMGKTATNEEFLEQIARSIAQ